jgi:glycosyltransferase involved in cell wall biosynthesis
MFEELCRRNAAFRIISTWADAKTLKRLPIGIKRALDSEISEGCLLDYTAISSEVNYAAFVKRAFRQRPGIKAAFTMFETNKTPASMVKAINENFDVLLSPSQFCTHVFEKSGVQIPVHTVGHGIDPEAWPLNPRTQTAKQLARPFCFLIYANAEWGHHRKNYQLTVDAFVDAFGSNPDVKLVLKTTGGAIPSHVMKLKNVEIISAGYSRQQLVDLLAKVDCLVFATNGEGFGLPPREAMATGVPAIVSNWGALETLAQVPGLCYGVPVRSLQKADYRCNPSFGSKDVGDFARILKADLAQSMRDAYDNQEKTLAMGQYAASWVRQNETVSQVVDNIFNVLEF